MRDPHEDMMMTAAEGRILLITVAVVLIRIEQTMTLTKRHHMKLTDHPRDRAAGGLRGGLLFRHRGGLLFRHQDRVRDLLVPHQGAADDEKVGVVMSEFSFWNLNCVLCF